MRATPRAGTRRSKEDFRERSATTETRPAKPLPQGSTSPAAWRLHGSNTIGLSLAPALSRAFLTSNGAQNVVLNDENRRSDRIWVQGVLSGQRRSIEIFAPGSKVGFASLGSGECDIGLASRSVTKDESELLRSLGDMNGPAADHVIGIDGIAIIVNESNRVRKLTLHQIGQIFAGELYDWSEVGGAPSPIHLYSRDTNSGTHDGFASMVMEGKTIKSEAKAFDNSEALFRGGERRPLGHT